MGAAALELATATVLASVTAAPVGALAAMAAPVGALAAMAAPVTAAPTPIIPALSAAMLGPLLLSGNLGV